MLHCELMDMLMDHYENPRNLGVLTDADFVQHGGHSGCGDTITVYVKMDGDVVSDVRFEGKGCMVSQAAASLVSSKVGGKNVEKILATGRESMIDILGKEIVVRRPQCSMLALNTIKSGLLRIKKEKERAFR